MAWTDARRLARLCRVRHCRPFDHQRTDSFRGKGSKDPNALLYESGDAKDDPLSAIKTVQAPTANQRAAEQPSNAADQAATGESYSIQAGAFRNAKDAEKVRTELAFIALEADVVKSTDAGITLYRVYLGPFETAREANELQQRLTANGFDAMVIRNK